VQNITDSVAGLEIGMCHLAAKGRQRYERKGEGNRKIGESEGSKEKRGRKEEGVG